MPDVEFKRIGTFLDFFNENRDKRVLILYGGAGSGKSHSVTQELCTRLINEDDIRMLIVRQTFPALRITALTGVRDMLDYLGVNYRFNKTENILYYKNNRIIFRGIDDPEKIKSVEANYVWVEEATDLTSNAIKQLNTRMRRANKNGKNQMFLTFNPIDAYHHIITGIVEPARAGLIKGVAIHHSTYLVNPFLDDEYREHLEGMIHSDYNFYRIYTLGEPGVIDGLVLKNWRVGDDGDRGIWTLPPVGYGIDYGFNSPSTITAVWFRDGVIYARNIFYARKKTNSDLISWIHEQWDYKGTHKLMFRDIPSYPDCAEPDRIEEMRRAEIICYPSDKSVKKGLEILKSHPIVVHPESLELIRELKNYKYRQHPRVEDAFLDEVVKEFDHAIDGIRYVVSTANIDGIVIPIDVIKHHSVQQISSSTIESRVFNAIQPRKKSTGVFSTGMKIPNML